jgi:hypothetical protein
MIEVMTSSNNKEDIIADHNSNTEASLLMDKATTDKIRITPDCSLAT